MTTKKTKTDHRSAVSGQFVTKKYAEKHPAQTVKERNPLPTKKRG